MEHQAEGAHRYVEFGNRTLTFVVTAAVLAALVAAWRYRGTLRREIEFRWREQASRVWVASQYCESLDAWVGVLRNASDQPIYDVHVRLRARSDPDTLLDEKFLTTLLPGHEATVTSHDVDLHVKFEGIGPGTCAATFRDSSGALFERTEAGSLKEINESSQQRRRQLRARLQLRRRRSHAR